MGLGLVNAIAWFVVNLVAAMPSFPIEPYIASKTELVSVTSLL
jgi:hypothetical protein